MPDVTLTDAGGTSSAVLTAGLWLQRAGNWSVVAERLDAAAPPSGKVTLSWQGSELTGYVLRSALEDGMVSAVILGGAGGLTKALQPKMYDYQLAAIMVVEDIMSEAGERLSPLARPALLTSLSSWVRRAGDASDQLTALTDALGCVWRVGLDGMIWIGVDSFWPVGDWDHDVPQDGWHSSRGCLEVVPSAIGAQPGQRYSRDVGGIQIAGRIGAATYYTSEDGPEARLYFVDERAAGEGAAEALRAFVRETMRGVELLGTLTGKVALQRPDGTLDVYPDDKTMPPMTSVRVRVPVPGAKLRVVSGARCRVVFEGGDIRQRVATLYEPGSATRAVARVGDKTVAHTHTVVFALTAPMGGGPVTGTITLTNSSPAIAEGSPDLSLP